MSGAQRAQKSKVLLDIICEKVANWLNRTCVGEMPEDAADVEARYPKLYTGAYAPPPPSPALEVVNLRC